MCGTWTRSTDRIGTPARARSIRERRSLHATAKTLAKQEHVSVNQLISTAVAEKISALMTEDYLEDRAKRGRRKDYEAVLAKVPEVEADERDRF